MSEILMSSDSTRRNGGDVIRMASQDLDKFSIPLIQKKTIQRTCKGPISIKRVDPKGDFIVIENTCIRKPVVMTNWTLRRRGVDVPVNSFKFDKHFVLHPNKSVKIFAKDKGGNNPPNELASDSVITWGVGTYAFTQLVNHLNQEKANLLEKVEHYERELQINVNHRGGTETHHRSTSRHAGDAAVAAAAAAASSSFDTFGPDTTDYEFYYERNIRP